MERGKDPLQPLRLAVLLSGKGSGLISLLDEIEAGRVPGEVVVVISSQEKAQGLARAQERGIQTLVVPRDRTQGNFQDHMHAALDQHHVDLVVLLGFLSMFEPRGYAGRVISVHPSLIPAFSGKGMYGDHVHRAALQRGVQITGATVHFVDEDYDTGPILLQQAVPVLPSDDVRSLRERVQAAEHEMVPEVIRRLNRLRKGNS